MDKASHMLALLGMIALVGALPKLARIGFAVFMIIGAVYMGHVGL